MNRRHALSARGLVRLLFAPVAWCAILPLVVGCSSEPGADDEGSVDSVGESITTSPTAIMARAQQWVDLRVPYCGGVRGGTDYICGGICNRPSEPWNGYRSDCSGFVSWAWQIPDDPTTYGYINDRAGENGWSSVGIDDLRRGDAIVCDGHIKLFDAFVGANTARIYEEYDCGKVARIAVQSFTRIGGNRLRFNGDGRVYHPIRRHSLTGDPGVGGPCEVHASDAKLYCTNSPNAAMHAGTNAGSPVVNHLQTTYSWFDCWGTGELHAGGNTTWYHTIGDENANAGWVPAVDLSTTSAFDANPTAHGLPQCGSPPPPPPPPPDPSCSVHADGRLWCNNAAGSPIHTSATGGSTVVDHLRTTTSWFDCWTTGEMHAGGNTTWYHTEGDDAGRWGFVPAVDLMTPNAFDADPAARGLRRCGS